MFGSPPGDVTDRLETTSPVNGRLHTLTDMLPTRAGPAEPATAVQSLLADAALGVAVFGTLAAMISADLGSERGPQVLAYLFAFALGAMMLGRRRYPLLILGLSVGGLFGYYAAGYPVIGLSVPAVAALFSAAQFRRPQWSIGAAGVLIVVGYGVRLVQGQDVAMLVGYELANDVLLMAAAIALGISLRLRGQLRRSSERLLRATAERERVQSEAAITALRADIARELHDSLGHQSTVISMHTDVARESLATDPPAAQRALDVVTRTNSSMMNELRHTVRTLRQSRPTNTNTSLATLEQSLLAELPIAVDAMIRIDHELPPQLETTVVRIVQEALTNVVKHSRADAARLRIVTDATGLHITVADIGPAALAESGSAPGFGIAGMVERAGAVGGELTAGPESAGFVVRARLPLPTRFGDDDAEAVTEPLENPGGAPTPGSSVTAGAEEPGAHPGGNS